MRLFLVQAFSDFDFDQSRLFGPSQECNRDHQPRFLLNINLRASRLIESSPNDFLVTSRPRCLKHRAYPQSYPRTCLHASVMLTGQSAGGVGVPRGQINRFNPLTLAKGEGHAYNLTLVKSIGCALKRLQKGWS